MLTDYHMHLRSDDLAASAAEHFTAENAAHYRSMARDRGIEELGVSEHVYRFRQALSIWEHPFWRENALDDLDAYCAFVRSETDLRLGLEVDFVPGREDRTANLIERLDLDYVVGSVHFIPLSPRGRAGAGTAAAGAAGFAAVDMAEYGVWQTGLTAEKAWSRYFETLGEAAGSGLFDILAHPDLVKVFGSGAPTPEGDLRRFYELCLEGVAESGIAVEVSTAGLRKPAREIYPAPALLAMCVEAGAGVALSSDAHRAADIGADYDRALELLSAAGVRELCVFDRRARTMEQIGPGGQGRPAGNPAEGIA
ncbi:MAG: histidinol-phosphatase [Acidobacteriota bacterium]|nr:histidinol-phosphatase [Acidobacteriota bacterium]